MPAHKVKPLAPAQPGRPDHAPLRNRTVFGTIGKKIFGSKNDRVIKGMQPLVSRINGLEPDMQAKSDDELRGMTGALKLKLDNGATLDDVLPEAFAVCREAGKRVMSMRHYDVQLIGGMVLHNGSIAEMKTGEGKTLVGTLPVYLNALSGKGVHLVTVNEYLAARDAEWMGRLYNFLNLSVGVIVHGKSNTERQKNYRCDITYGTNSEFGFDYLRDNMKDSLERYVQRELNFAIVDEVDSILIDEARTPLIISGPAEQSADLYKQVSDVIPALRKDIDYTVDEKAHSAILTDSGVERVEQKLGLQNLYAPENLAWVHQVGTALRAHSLYKRNVNYLIEDGKVVIVDEFTGRKMPGRRWSDGLHQAVEAKEGVAIQEENQTLATISYQNYFRLYNKLAGMTGTADTEAEEFHKIYKLDVTVVPTNKPKARLDSDDLVYKSERGKFMAVVEDIEDCHKRGQPVLVGTVSVEKSEVVASLLRKKGIPHSVLNAKQHGREAEVVAQAGRKGAVTISTNMAGRGTDIILGGNAEYMARAAVDPEAAGQPGAKVDQEQFEKHFAEFKPACDSDKKEVLEAGGLHIIGTERHESRRIDNQLRGRAGRQGDPGSSRFFLSLEDDLMRIFGAERIQGIMGRLGMEEDVPIEHGFINKAIANAQKKVEGHHFDSRKNLLEYDDVMNQQRKAVYALRRQILAGEYARELTDAEKQNEKKARKPKEIPTTSGSFTIEKLARDVRPQLGRMAESLTRQPVEEGTDGAQYDAARNQWYTSVALNGDRLRSAVYRQFGTLPDVDGVEEARSETLDRIAQDVAASLIQQRERILDLVEDVVYGLIDEHCPPGQSMDLWDINSLAVSIEERFGFRPKLRETGDRSELAERLWTEIEKIIEARETEFSIPMFLYFSRSFLIEEIDQRWIDHLKGMEQLREGIGLRGYGQRDPKQEYKREGFAIFGQMMEILNRNVCEKLFHMQLQRDAQTAATAQQNAAKRRRAQRRTVESGGDSESKQGQSGSAPQAAKAAKTVRRDQPKVGRNDPCPCGSGKKYKKCCGAPGALAGV